MAVYVVDRRKKPIAPCSERRARLLLQRGRARVHRKRPFTIRLVDVLTSDVTVEPLTLRIDPGSKTSGVALTREVPVPGQAKPHVQVLNLMEIAHRGHVIRDRLYSRRAFRRRRRGYCRYRPARFQNRTRPEGWLAPSLQHRVDTIVSQVRRLQSVAPIHNVVQELVRFDTQLMQEPTLKGIEYQQGTLQGYEVREYLLEKWQRRCVYCDRQNVPLQMEHLEPRSRGGSNRVSNLTLACGPCNTRKAAMPLADFLRHDTARLARLVARAEAPLRDAAAVNSTRFALYRELQSLGLTVTTGTGGQTKYNRTRFGVPKTHALDAACTGNVLSLSDWQRPTLCLQATGRGSYCRTRLDKYGFRRGLLMRQKQAFGFSTGDLVRAVVLAGKKAGTYFGRVAIRKTGSFNITTETQTVQGISHRYCRRWQRADGYAATFAPTVVPVVPTTGTALSRRGLSLPAVNDRVSRPLR